LRNLCLRDKFGTSSFGGLRKVIRVDIKPELLSWARQCAGLETDALSNRFPKLAAWEQGTVKPTLKQIEDFAKATHTPVGFLFLQEPPVEKVPIPDFRTIRNKAIARPSPDLLDMIYVCQQRQEWYRDFARSERASPLSLVGSASLSTSVESTVATMRHALGFDVEQRSKISTWSDALRLFIGQADEAGIMVMCSGVVLNNNTRRLDPEEFRGFALSDNLAPLVFINGADTKAAQIHARSRARAYLAWSVSGFGCASFVGSRTSGRTMVQQRRRRASRSALGSEARA
jgi:hypothetical protein